MPQHSQKRKKKNINDKSKQAAVNSQPKATSSSDPLLIIDFFRATFDHLFTSSLPNVIQQVKHHLYNREYDIAFGSQENLEAYVVRWSVARALAYRDMILDGWWSEELRGLLENSKEDLHICCIGGGAGAELVGFAGAVCELWGYQKTNNSLIENIESRDGKAPTFNTEFTSSSSHTSSKLHISAIDFADWSSIVDNLCTSITTSKYNHSLHIPPAYLTATFEHADVLKPTGNTLSSILTSDVITILFTAGELYTQSPVETTKFFLSLRMRVKEGALLVIVDSAGGFEDLALHSDKKEGSSSVSPEGFKLNFVLDRTLEGRGGWKLLKSDNARWWRLPDELQTKAKDKSSSAIYPLQLESMRCLVRVYQRIADEQQK